MSVLAPGATVSRVSRVRIAIAPELPAGSRFAPWLALAAGLVGVVVLIGWFGEISSFRSLLPGLPTMKVNTAVGLVALGVAVAVLSLQRPGRYARRVALILAAGVVALALATLLEYLLGVNFGIDELVRRDDGPSLLSLFPGRMAVATITAFTFAGMAVVSAAAGWRTLAAGLAYGSVALGWLSLLGYVYGYQEIRGLGSGTQMAIHTAVGQVLIAAAILIGPLASGTSVLSRGTIGGSAARRVAVASVVLLAAVGFARLAGERAGLFEPGFGITMMTAVSTIGVVLVAIWLGRSLERMTAQRDASAAVLAAVLARYQAATEAIPDAFYLFRAERDQDGQIVDFTCTDLNSKAAAIWGSTPEALRGRRMRDQAPTEAPRFIAAYASVVETGTTTERDFAVNRAGTSMWTRHQVMKVGDGVALISRDVTEKLRARDALSAVNRQLEERNADLRDFASVVSHDIRAPLRRIQMYGEQLELDAGERLGDDLPLLQRIRTSAGKLEKLVAELLSYARVDEGDRPFKLIDLNILVAEVLEDLELPLRECGGGVEVGALPDLIGEPVLLRQLFTNLIGNAIKFRRPDTALQIFVTGKVRLDLDGMSWTEVVVRDNGIGFDQQYADRIFKIFERLHGEREYAGTGIGLAICRKIALYHQGTIAATGRQGDGATFTVRLPRPAGSGQER